MRVEALLGDGDEADPEDVAEQQDEQRGEPGVEALGHQRDGEAEQAVEAEFLQHAGVQHGDRGRGAGIGGRGPGVEGEERDERAEADEQQGGDAFLGGGIDGAVGGDHRGHVEGAGEVGEPDEAGEQDDASRGRGRW